MIITLLEVSQTLPTRPSDGNSMKTKVCEEEGGGGGGGKK